MDQQQEQLEALKDIKDMMERSSKFLSLSGLAGVVVGIFAITGIWAIYCHFNLSFSQDVFAIINKDAEQVGLFIRFLLIDAGIVLFISLATGIIMAKRRAEINGAKLWDASAKRMFTHLMIPLITGGLLSLILLSQHQFQLLAPVTLIFYGLALVNASKFTIDHIQFLGFGEIVTGLLAVAFPTYGLLLWAFGFGVLHILYGIVFYIKFEK